MNRWSTSPMGRASLVSLGASLVVLTTGCGPGRLTGESPRAWSDATTPSAADGRFSPLRDAQPVGEEMLAMDSGGGDSQGPDQGTPDLRVDVEICRPVCSGKLCGAGDGCHGTCDSGSGCWRSCAVSGVELKHGESRVFYSHKTLPFGSSCDDYAEQRECTDGQLSGSNTVFDCSVTPSACGGVVLPSNLASTAATLDAHPPWPEDRARNNAILSLDAFLQKVVGGDDADTWTFNVVRQASALDEMRTTSPAPGRLAIWQLYNMGYVVRSEDVTACFDVVPANLRAPALEPACAAEVTLGVVDECDILLVSHYHGDHANTSVMLAFLDSGKPVIAPKQTWDFWIGQGGLTEADRARTQHLQRLSPTEAHHRQTVSLSGNRTLDVVVYPGNQGPTIDNNVYVVYMTDTITFAHLGDQASSPQEPLWRPNVKDHHEIDFYVSSLTTADLILGFDPDVLIPGHRNEIGHHGATRLSFADAYTSLRPYLGARQLMLLTWGELATVAVGTPGTETFDQRFEAETELLHQTGSLIADGWRVTVNDPSGYMAYGPYTNALVPGVQVAEFSLRVDNATATNIKIATLDVRDVASGTTFAQRTIYRHDFHRNRTYQPFRLTYETPYATNQQLEFRVLYHGSSLLDLEHVDAHRRSYHVANSRNELNRGDVLATGEALYSADGRFLLVMQSDCNLVMYWRSNENQVLWNSETPGAGTNCYLAMQQGDGRLVVYNSASTAVWHTGAAGGDVAKLQNDGNFVLLGPSTALWASGPSGH